MGSRQPCDASRSGRCRLAALHTAAGGRPPPSQCRSILTLPAVRSEARADWRALLRYGWNALFWAGFVCWRVFCLLLLLCTRQARPICAGVMCCWWHDGWRLQLFLSELPNPSDSASLPHARYPSGMLPLQSLPLLTTPVGQAQ